MTPALDKDHGRHKRRKRSKRPRRNTPSRVLDSISPVINSHDTGISSTIEQLDIDVEIDSSIKSQYEENRVLRDAIANILKAFDSEYPEAEVSIYEEGEKRVIEVKTPLEGVEEYQQKKSLVRSTVRVEEPNELTFYTRVSSQ